MRKYFCFTLLVIMLLILSACSDDSEVTPDGEESAEAEGGDLVMSFPTDIISMDPHGSEDVPSEQVRNTIYEGLVKHDVNMEIVEGLATEWEQIDETTWEFKLREDVTFHDGSEFNAEVVKANIDRVQDIARASPREFILEMISEVNIIDDYTVEIVTEYPFSPLLGNLSHGAGKMLSKDLIDEDYQNAIDEAGLDTTLEEYYEIRKIGGEEHEEIASQISNSTGAIVEQKPVGTGYLQFDSRNPGETTKLVAYEDYWDGPPTIDSAEFKAVSETNSRIAELETGTSDFIARSESNNIDRIESNENLTLEKTDALAIDYIGINTEKEPFNNKLVRQAITHAFDQEAVLTGVFNGSGTPAIGPLSPVTLGYDENLERLEYDMDRARELLKEAGYEDGFDATIMVNEDNPERLDTAIWMQESLAELNINIDIEQVEWGAYLEMTGNGEHDMFVLGWSNPPADPNHLLSTLFHSDMIGNAGNRSFFSNEEFDELIDEGKKESDEDAREEIYKQAQEILIDEAPAIFIRYPENLNAYQSNISGLKIDNNNLLDLRNVTRE
ncbi:glutathione ABC transporter substrate-binding protein [Jeotgalicoccus sp. ATCC 8456]|uniref:glutathione ABC transporter substrate-binding protein n=1 Tax=Jeotgalicoccus sp. ATCC 8456 TaxID=946435 RepID=UPI0018E63C0D|nr:glutathione ABC transporter substrate-binding protein [Jeotgalicoccus sp. ATCC 8456]QQD85336.1 glutathione ABC transporter substrate-binding protein [Jeotgalicoccus sp. ATCC 8456]